MRVLLSTIGSRGDVQPLVAPALELRVLGQEARLCVPPDFRDWIDGLGIPVTPIGPELRKLTASSPPATPAPLSPELRRQMVEATARAPRPAPREPARPKSSSPRCTTSTTGPNASTTSASDPRTHPAHRPPTR